MFLTIKYCIQLLLNFEYSSQLYVAYNYPRCFECSSQFNIVYNYPQSFQCSSQLNIVYNYPQSFLCQLYFAYNYPQNYYCSPQLNSACNYSKTCLKWLLKNRQNKYHKEKWWLNDGQKYCRMLSWSNLQYF